MELQGKVKLIERRTTRNGKEIADIIISTTGKYPQDIILGVMDVAKVAGLEPGDEVKVQFDIRGREYQGRHYVNLVAWKIERAGTLPPAQSTGNITVEPEDDLPF